MSDFNALVDDVERFDLEYNVAVRECNILRHEMESAGPKEAAKLKAKIELLEVKIKDLDKKEKNARKKLDAHMKK